MTGHFSTMSSNGVDAATLQKACDEFMANSEERIEQKPEPGMCSMTLRGLSWPASPFSSALGYRQIKGELLAVSTEAESLKKLDELSNSKMKPKEIIKTIMQYAEAGTDTHLIELRSIYAGCYHDPNDKNIWWVEPGRLHQTSKISKAALNRCVKEKLVNQKEETQKKDREHLNKLLDTYNVRKGMWVPLEQKELEYLYI